MNMIRYYCPLLTNPFSIFFNIITLNKMKIAVDITQKKRGGEAYCYKSNKQLIFCFFRHLVIYKHLSEQKVDYLLLELGKEGRIGEVGLGSLFTSIHTALHCIKRFYTTATSYKFFTLISILIEIICRAYTITRTYFRDNITIFW